MIVQNTKLSTKHNCLKCFYNILTVRQITKKNNVPIHIQLLHSSYCVEVIQSIIITKTDIFLKILFTFLLILYNSN